MFIYLTPVFPIIHSASLIAAIFALYFLFKANFVLIQGFSALIRKFKRLFLILWFYKSIFTVLIINFFDFVVERYFKIHRLALLKYVINLLSFQQFIPVVFSLYWNALFWFAKVNFLQISLSSKQSLFLTHQLIFLKYLFVIKSLWYSHFIWPYLYE